MTASSASRSALPIYFLQSANFCSPVALLTRDCWLNVLEHLSPEDYWPLLFVSKSSASFMEPFLLRKIAWSWRPIPFRRILLLFRAVQQKPERASHIRHLSLLSYEDLDSTDDWEPPSCETDCKQELTGFKDVLHHAQSIVKTTKFPDADSWILALEDGNPYAFVSTFISQLHNLQFLHLDYSFVWQSGFPGLMLRHSLSSSNPSLSRFHSLTDVDYGANVRRATRSMGAPEIFDEVEEPGYPECNPEQFPAWFYLPSIRSLKIWLRTKNGIQLPDRNLPDLSGLERLILSRTTIQEAQVSDILPLAPRLKTLHLGMAYRYSKETALKDGQSIMKGLKSVKGSLTNLSFGVEYYPPTICDVYLQDGEEELSDPFYGLLEQFPNIRSVEFPVNLLTGWSTEPSTDLTSGLPEQIEQLCLRADYQTVDENGWHEGEILDLVSFNVARLRSRIPGLSRICVRKWRPFNSVRAIDEKRDVARAACAREGIRLEVVSDHVSNGIWTEARMCPERKVL